MGGRFGFALNVDVGKVGMYVSIAKT